MPYTITQDYLKEKSIITVWEAVPKKERIFKDIDLKGGRGST